MTYLEKFKEIFGYYPDSCNKEDVICDFVDCEAIPCLKCKYLREDGTHVKWGDEMKDQKLKKAQRKFEITEKLHKLGYEYKTRLWDDGTICTHRFIYPDSFINDGCYWEVAIEDHTDDYGDYIIYVGYHDPNQKDWDGHQIDISGCVEFEAMKLIVEFAEILKKENEE